MTNYIIRRLMLLPVILFGVTLLIFGTVIEEDGVLGVPAGQHVEKVAGGLQPKRSSHRGSVEAAGTGTEDGERTNQRQGS